MEKSQHTPIVSVIVPCYNEETTIGLLLEALSEQTFPLEAVEVVIADGLSTDRTREEIVSFQAKNPGLRIKVIDNEARIIPAGLNIAIKESRGTYIIRLDAHAVPNLDYIERCVGALDAGKGDNVGGVWEIKPSSEDWVARSIARAAGHPLGVGDARYRVGGQPQLVDTVPFGAFQRSLIDQIGPFDESLLSNEDYEFNVRLRSSGGQIWLDPAIRSVYFARSTIESLARQYWRYGYWKAQMLRRYPHTLRWRQLSALLVLSLSGLAILSIFWPFARWLLATEVLVYGGALLLAGLQVSIQDRDIHLLAGVPLAIGTMHLTWGTAFLWSLTQNPTSRT
jgi:glycosyltransferase involved in cell wall biosynthesis